MIEIKHLKMQFKEATPLKDVNTVINNGDVISVIGPSGTGKSTLIRCINMLNIPTEGQIIVDGIDVTNPKTDINAARLKIGMVFQSFNLYEHITVIENIMLAQTKLLNTTPEDAYKKGMELLKKVGLEEKALQYPNQLSGGQKQRVAIARTLATDPEIILFDEPTSALDPLSVGEIEELIGSLASKDRIMMIVTHSMSFAKKVSNRIFFMDQGGIYEDGTPDQIFNHPQKERTQKFVFYENNLELNIEKKSFILRKTSEDILAFSEKHRIGDRRTSRIQSVFEEICVVYLLPMLNDDDQMKILFSYNENKDKITITATYPDKGIAKLEDDEISYKIISAFTTKLSTEKDGENAKIIAEM